MTYSHGRSLLYVNVNTVNATYNFHHQQNHNVHVHSKVTVTAASVQNKCA